MAKTKIMETLLRIEHKLDILLQQTKFSDTTFPTMGDANNKCPICNQIVSYTIDIADSVVIRKCSCSSGKIAVDISAFAPTPTDRKNYGRSEESEDGKDSDSGSGRSRRR